MGRLAVALTAGLIGWTQAGTASGGEPEGFQRLTSHRPPSIDHPEFVPASQARIPDNAWVIGVWIDGETRAYSQDLLNGFEVVNDRSKYFDFSVIWSPVANAAVVFERRYKNLTLRFESTGGVVNGSPVLRDKETRSYWSLMSGEAIAGPMRGTKLKQLPMEQRWQWSDWKANHPETRVLAVGKVTHWYTGAYDEYFSSANGYDGLTTQDDRLPTKAPIYAFRLAAVAHAIPHEAIEGGRVFDVEGSTVFVFRPAGSPPFKSSVGFAGAGFESVDGVWTETQSGRRFSPAKEMFEGARCPHALEGFDTFWYAWSLNNPKTVVVR